MLSSAYRSEYTVHSNGVGLVLEQLSRVASGSVRVSHKCNVAKIIIVAKYNCSLGIY